jgi:hypothetical protein
MRHHIERTSPKGGPFVGTCLLCGATNLRPSDAHKDCPNVRGLTEAEAVLESIDGRPTKLASGCGTRPRET